MIFSVRTRYRWTAKILLLSYVGMIKIYKWYSYTCVF